MTDQKFNSYLYASALCANLLSFGVGSAFSWTSPVLPKLVTNDPNTNPFTYAITTFEESWIVCMMSLGSIIGSLISAPIVERVGRKKTLLFFSSAMFIPHIMFAFGRTVNIYLLGRLILGLGVGSIYSTMPSYIGEISEDTNRGLLGCIMGVMIFLGSFYNYLFGPFVNIRTLSFLNIIPICLFYPACYFWLPETPYYFLSKNDEIGAYNSLRKIRTKPQENLEKEIELIKECVRDQINNQGGLKDLCSSKALINGLLVTSGLFVLQQLTGVSAICAYMEFIFEKTQMSIPPHIAAIIIGIVPVIANIFTTLLVDRLGRRFLLLISTVGLYISTSSLGTYFYLKSNDFRAFNINWLPLTSLIIFMFMYNIGIGPISWLLTGEVFPSNVKTLASSISTCICLSATFLVSLIFPYMKIVLDLYGSFWLFSCICLVAVIFVALKVPETKGVSLHDIQNILIGYKPDNSDNLNRQVLSRTSG